MRAFPRHVIRCLLSLVSLVGASVHAGSPYDQVFDDLFARYQLPGLAVGVIEDGKVVYKRTAGERIAGSGDLVDTRTLFKIASNSKAMTASVLARLVDAGKLQWDDPVHKHLPQFRMFDPWVTRNMRVADLLVHNSGLPEGGGDLMLWPEPNHFTRADIIAGLGHIKPAYGFRAGYAYDNLLYVVAGEVAAAVAGVSYEELVRREIFTPLGLQCRVGQWQRTDSDNIAQPHAHKDGRNVPYGEDGAVVPEITSAAAGGIRCSLDDMLAWARAWLDPATAPGWLSEEQRRQAWVPRTPMPVSACRRDWDGTRLYAYGYGWRIADVDGVLSYSHTGTLSGMYSVMTLLPDRQSGFVVLMNGEADDARTVLNEVLLKRHTRPQLHRGVADVARALENERAGSPQTVAASTARAAPRRPAGDAMRQWWGIYRDPWFGQVRICPQAGQTRFASDKSPLLSGRVLESAGRLLVDWDDEGVDAEAWLDFHPGQAGGASRLTMAKTDPKADFSYDYEDLSFERVAACE